MGTTLPIPTTTFSLKRTAKAHENPHGFLVNTIKMVDFPASYVSFREGNSLHLKIDGWNISFLVGWPIFREHVSFREGTVNSLLVLGSVYLPERNHQS